MLAALPVLAQAPSYTGHGAASVSAETLAKFAPAPLPEELSRRVQSMMDLLAPGTGEVSPDGKRLYFGWAVTGSRQIWRLDGPNHFPIQMTGGEDSTTLAAISPNGKTLIVQRDRKGEENPGLYTMPADGGALTCIQHLPGIKTTFAFLSEDGQWLYYQANDQKPDAYAIYRYNLGTSQKEVLLAEPGLWDIADHLPSGRLLLQKATGSQSSEYFEWDPSTRKLLPLLGQGETQEYTMAYGAKPGQFLVLTNKFGEFRKLYRFESGKFTPIGPSFTWDISSFTVDERRTRILTMINEGGYTRLNGLDAKTFAPIQLPKLPEADHIHAGSTTPDGRYTTLGVETAQAPRTSWVYDWKTKSLTQWVMPSSPEVDTKTFSVATLEYYPAKDGTKIPMFVRRPKNPSKGPLPVVVNFHGGPEGQSKPGFSSYAQLFVDAGFIFVQPNVRGSDGYGKTWLDADNGPKRLQVITDIQDCGEYIRKAWAVDGKAPKIGIMGGSYGGYATLMGMTLFAGTYDAGVSNVGISNLVTFLNNTAPYRRILRSSEYGDPVKDHDALVKLSATTYIDRLKSPLLVIQGASDPRVPVGEAIQMHEAISKRNVPSGLIIFPDEGHGSQKRGNRVLQIGHTIAWMQKYLQCDESVKP
jgi:dipeptidyl aminopeptidase/acylaminoacyl peptidase